VVDLQSLADALGPLAVFSVAALEGDAAVLTAGILVQRGFLDFWPAFAAAAAGGWASDQFFYFLARAWRGRPRVEAVLARAREWRLFQFLIARPVLLALVIRFLPGMRTLGPVTLAVGTPMTPVRFMLLTGFASIVWAGSLILIGQGAGHALQRAVSRLNLPDNTGLYLLLVILAALTILALRHLRPLLRGWWRPKGAPPRRSRN
jgi:membrane protein DedA with SNARE-associated domain